MFDKLKSLLIKNQCELCGMVYRSGETHECEALCLICKQEFRSYQRIMNCNDCGHPFHSDHLETWYATNDDCPVCRLSLRQEFGDTDECLYCLSTLKVENCDTCNRGCTICDTAILVVDPIIKCKSCYQIYHQRHKLERQGSKIDGVTGKSYTSITYKKNNAVYRSLRETNYCEICTEKIENQSNGRVKPIKFRKLHRYHIVNQHQEETLDIVLATQLGIIFILFAGLAVTSLVVDVQFLLEMYSESQLLNFILNLLIFIVVPSGGWIAIFIIFEIILKFFLLTFMLLQTGFQKVRKTRFDTEIISEIEVKPYNIIIFFILYVLGVVLVIYFWWENIVDENTIITINNAIQFVLFYLLITGLGGFVVGMILPQFKNYWKRE